MLRCVQKTEDYPEQPARAGPHTRFKDRTTELPSLRIYGKNVSNTFIYSWKHITLISSALFHLLNCRFWFKVAVVTLKSLYGAGCPFFFELLSDSLFQQARDFRGAPGQGHCSHVSRRTQGHELHSHQR